MPNEGQFAIITTKELFNTYDFFELGFYTAVIKNNIKIKKWEGRDE